MLLFFGLPRQVQAEPAKELPAKELPGENLAGPPIGDAAAEMLDAALIDVYTMGPGPEIVQRYGHAAICVSRHNATRCYNYGTTAFSKPLTMSWNFLRGRARFWVSSESFDSMLADYTRDNRTVWRQPLPLPPSQANQLADMLEENAKPENRYYAYRHFTDNCSTRVRDLLEKVSGGDWPEWQGEMPTLRSFARQGLADSAAMLIFSDLFFGRHLDQTPTAREAMFLPLQLQFFIAARYGAAPELVFAGQNQARPDHNQTAFFYWLMIVLTLCLLARSNNRWGLRFSGFLLGLLGLAVWTMVLASSVPEFQLNENVLIFMPTDFLLGWLPQRFARRYAQARLLLLAVALLLCLLGLLLQPLWLYALWPLGVLSSKAALSTTRPG